MEAETATLGDRLAPRVPRVTTPPHDREPHFTPRPPLRRGRPGHTHTTSRTPARPQHARPRAHLAPTASAEPTPACAHPGPGRARTARLPARPSPPAPLVAESLRPNSPPEVEGRGAGAPPPRPQHRGREARGPLTWLGGSFLGRGRRSRAGASEGSAGRQAG